jgi:polyphosphate kinase
MSSSPFFNRELSWIEFNARVLAQALRDDVPLLERLRFLCIVTSNFDEFFMVRVATVRRAVRSEGRYFCPSGISPETLLDRMHRRIRELVEQKYRCLLDAVLPKLANEGIRLLRPRDYSQEVARRLNRRFQEEIYPVLSPVRATSETELPYVANLRLHAAFLLRPDDSGDLLRGDEEPRDEYLAIVQIPPSLPRLVFLPGEDNTVAFALLEDVIAQHAGALFPGYRIEEHCFFRVTRDADLGVDEEQEDGFLEAMEQVLVRREYSDPVRLSVSQGTVRLKETLAGVLGLSEQEIYEKPEPLELTDFMAVVSIPGYEHLRYERWPVTPPPAVPAESDLWAVLRRQDVLLHHPYEAFDPVVRLVQEAAEDPEVLAIKMTLYRTSGDSKIVAALERASQLGKQVTVLVEVKARFDEEQNITWAQRLERAGAIVIHGIVGLKVHAKALLIVRREERGIKRYVHLGTGNYNEKTARLYTDVGLMTTAEEIGYEVGLFFNAITGYSATPALSALAMAPTGMKRQVLQLIERETLRARSGSQAMIQAKMNSLADPEVIEALYAASQAGVTVRLNIRGICMLVPGVNGKSDTISVVSIVDRYLEHARLFYVYNDGAPEVYGSSADWMPRNLDRRVELLFPITDPNSVERVMSILDVGFRDTSNAHLLKPDGSYARRTPARGQPPIRSQMVLTERCAARSAPTQTGDATVFQVRRSPAD